MRRTNTVIIGTGALGVVTLATGIALGWFGFPALVVNEIKHGVLLVNGTEAYDRWRKLPVALFFKVYVFNVTNSEDVQNGANPIVQEVGPYVYDQYREKFDIEDNSDGTLSYVQNSTFYFNKEKSGNLSEDDVFTVINFGLLGTALKIRKTVGSGLPLDDVLKEVFIGWDTIFHTATVKKLFWDGVTIINCTAKEMSFEAKMACTMLKPRLPVTVTEHEPGIFKLAYFRYKNNTNDGQFRVMSGVSDSRTLGRILEWRGQPNMTTWSGGICNTIEGTDSTIFPPFWSPKDKVAIFLSDMCRSMYAEFDSEMTWKGIKAFSYYASPLNLKSAKDYPPNICFCEHMEDEPPECLKSGAIDTYNCLGVSVIISLPHFYNASPEYRSYAKGLNPDREKHDTFIYIEPQTGIILRGSKRMQMNMFLTKMDELSALNNVSEGLFPLLWIDEGSELDDKNLAKVQRLYTVLCILSVVKWLVIAAGVLLMCVSLCVFAFKRQNGNKVTEMEDNNSAVVSYGNKAYLQQSDDATDAISISAISDIIHNERTGVKNRKNNTFPGKSQSSLEQNETNENVAHGVCRGASNAVTLSNVFM